MLPRLRFGFAGKWFGKRKPYLLFTAIFLFKYVEMLFPPFKHQVYYRQYIKVMRDKIKEYEKWQKPLKISSRA